MLTPDNVGIPVVGVHFLQGEFGVLLDPLKTAKPVRIAGSVRVFIEVVAETRGIALSGLLLS